MENTIKFYIECGNRPRNGYVNTTSSPNVLNSISNEMGDDIEVILSDFRKVHEIKQDIPVSDVIVGFYMNIMTLQEISEFLTIWTQRISPGGTLKLKFVDTRQVCRAAAFGSISLRDIHNMILGPEGGEFKSVSDFETIKASFDNSLFNIDYAKNDGYEIYIELERQHENKN